MKDIPHNSNIDKYSGASHLLTIEFEYSKEQYIECAIRTPYNFTADGRVTHDKNVRLWTFKHLHNTGKKPYWNDPRFDIEDDVCTDKNCRKKFPSFNSLVTAIRLLTFRDTGKLKVIWYQLKPTNVTYPITI